MAQRKTKIQANAWDGHTCGECVRGCYNLMNFNYEGKTFMIYCEHGDRGFSLVKKSNVTYADCAACEHFVQGKREGWK